jgi:hypothetical protein
MQYRGAGLQQELRLTEPIVLCSIVKWAWSRMPGGVVTWPVYQGFQIGEKESNMARNAFETFIPIGAGSEARRSIIFDFFDALAAVAAHGKMNGLGGRKLSRMAGWWAFEHSDDGKGFEGGYKSWTAAADASSHLFFAYLRSMSGEAEGGITLIDRIPRSLQALLASTEYPPETPTLMQRQTPRVVMIVDRVSPTPFALLRRAKHFEFRESDRVLRQYSEFEDPLDALTEECKRVLYLISSTNSAAAMSRHGKMVKTGQESWSAFQNLGFTDLDDKALQPTSNGMNGSAGSGGGLRSQARSRNAEHGRPTTPSWADFLSSGFNDEDMVRSPTTLSLPYDKQLPPIGSRAQTPSYSMMGDDDLAPGELAAVTNVDLDDAFWWVWMTSLAGEEPSERKAVFGRCALIETTIHGAWLIMEEQVKGASPDPAEGAFIAPKKSIFSFGKRGRNKKTKTDKLSPVPSEPLERAVSATPSKSSLAPDQQSKIKAAAAALARKQPGLDTESNTRRGRYDDAVSTKTSSMLTMGMMTEASPAMKWASAYDKNAIRAQYLGDSFAGKGTSREDLARKTSSTQLNGDRTSTVSPQAPALSPEASNFPVDKPQDRELPALPEAGPASTKPEQSSRIQQQTVSGAQAPSAPPVNDTPTQEVDEDDESPAPIPATNNANPLDKELAVDIPNKVNRVERKPVPRPEEHPAFRQKSIDESAQAQEAAAEPQTPTSPRNANNTAAIAAQRAMNKMSTSPESQKSEHAKLKKQPPGGSSGLKKLFGRKKDNPNRNSLEVRPSSNKGGLAPPSETNLGRRLSLMRNKKGPARPAQDVSHIVAPQPAPETFNEPMMPELPGSYDDNAMSQVDTRSDANADEEFSRFDQGPVEDVPSAVPQDSDHEDLPAPAPQRHFNTQIANRIVSDRQETERSYATPMERPPVDDDAQSEATMEEPQPLSPEPEMKDRWAQIRDNAARRAARASEEHSMQSRTNQSTRETDDGETSGEESKFSIRSEL